AGLEIYLRLVDEEELSSLERRPHVLFQSPCTGFGCGLDRRVDSPAGAADLLCLIERSLRGVDPRSWTSSDVACQGCASAYEHADDLVRVEGKGIVGRHGQHNAEHIPTKPADKTDIGNFRDLPRCRHQATGDRLQNLIAGISAERGVYRAEPMQIDREDRQRL